MVQPAQHFWHLASHPWHVANGSNFTWMERIKRMEGHSMDLPFNNINCGFKHECDLLWTLRWGSELENGKPNSSPSINQHTPPPPEWTGTATLSWNDSPLTHWDHVQRNRVQGIRRIPDKWERQVQMYIANDENWLHISSNCCWFNVG